MLPLFKSDFSIGRSILTTDLPSGKSPIKDRRSIFHLAKLAELQEIHLVEDSISGFHSTFKNAQKAGVELRYGLRLDSVHDLTDTPSRLVYFARNDEGFKALRSIHNQFWLYKQRAVFPSIQKFLSNILIAVPFYDSFVAKNQLHFGISHFPDLKNHEHVYFQEDNDHPFDSLISEKIPAAILGSKNGSNSVSVKSVFYPKRSHFAAYQFVRSGSNKQGGKKPTFYHPMTEHQCSAEYSFEAWWEQNKSEPFPF